MREHKDDLAPSHLPCSIHVPGFHTALAQTLERIASSFPDDFARITERVLGIEEFPDDEVGKCVEDGTIGEWRVDRDLARTFYFSKKRRSARRTTSAIS